MSIVFLCPICKTSYTVNDADAGKKSTCVKCGQRVQVPTPQRAKTVMGEEVKPDLPRASEAHPTTPALGPVRENEDQPQPTPAPEARQPEQDRTVTTNTRMGLIAGGIVLVGLTVLSVVLLLSTSTSSNSVTNGNTAGGKTSLFVADSNGSIYDSYRLAFGLRGKTKEQVRQILGEPNTIDYPDQHLKSKRRCIWTYKKWISHNGTILNQFEIEFDHEQFAEVVAVYD